MDSGGPTSTVISWIYALDHSTLRLAIDHRSRLVHNIKSNPHITVTLFHGDSMVAVNGKATTVQDPLQDVPFSMCLFDMSIDAVRNALFYGAKLKSPPLYTREFNELEAKQFDELVLAAMKKA
ncbi:hypothetical protein D3C75_991840 [compost metagenome]